MKFKSDSQRKAVMSKFQGKSIFFPAKSKRLARIITIENPAAFRKSIATLKKGGLSTKEKRALILAQNRARATLNRKNLSRKERKEMKTISRIKIK